MEQWQQFFTAMAALSAASQAFTENITKKVPFLSTQQADPQKEDARTTWIHLLCGLVGALMAYGTNFHPFSNITDAKSLFHGASEWVEYPVIGIMIAYGGSFFNDALDVLKSFSSAQSQLKTSLAAGTNNASAGSTTQSQLQKNLGGLSSSTTQGQNQNNTGTGSTDTHTDVTT